MAPFSGHGPLSPSAILGSVSICDRNESRAAVAKGAGAGSMAAQTIDTIAHSVALVASEALPTSAGSQSTDSAAHVHLTDAVPEVQERWCLSQGHTAGAPLWPGLTGQFVPGNGCASVSLQDCT